MINISINLGPGAIWIGMIFVTVWIGVGCFRAGRIYDRISSTQEIQHRQRQMLIAPWQAPGQPLLPSRVDPGLTLLRTYAPIEEDEAA